MERYKSIRDILDQHIKLLAFETTAGVVLRQMGSTLKNVLASFI
jgi:hypothetical protein